MKVTTASAGRAKRGLRRRHPRERNGFRRRAAASRAATRRLLRRDRPHARQCTVADHPTIAPFPPCRVICLATIVMNSRALLFLVCVSSPSGGCEQRTTGCRSRRRQATHRSSALGPMRRGLLLSAAGADTVDSARCDHSNEHLIRAGAGVTVHDERRGSSVVYPVPL